MGQSYGIIGSYEIIKESWHNENNFKQKDLLLGV